MLNNRGAAIALLIVLSLPLWGALVASQQPQSPHPHSNNSAQGAAKNQEAPDKKVNPSTGSYLQKYSAYCAAKPTQENDKWRHDFWCEFKVTDLVIAVFAVVLAVVTGGLILVGICQIRLARDEFISSHRPKLVVRNVHIIREFKEEWPVGSPLGVNFEIANVGGTPTHIVGTEMSIAFIAGGLLPSPRNPRQGQYAMPGWENFEIKPGALVQQWYGSPEAVFKAEHFTRFHSNYHGLFFVGHILYEDRSEIVRRTSFCRRFDGERAFWRKAEYYDYEHQD